MFKRGKKYNILKVSKECASQALAPIVSRIKRLVKSSIRKNHRNCDESQKKSATFVRLVIDLFIWHTFINTSNDNRITKIYYHSQSISTIRSISNYFFFSRIFDLMKLHAIFIYQWWLNEIAEIFVVEFFFEHLKIAHSIRPTYFSVQRQRLKCCKRRKKRT